ncbi:hypothetical protein Oter_2758 [Opitutus terrae PB90-1]|uniref:Uncharacterized protein n=1 Tax=Opitutus terrae (strain DSM 11246 / JCM 15787 / PB90-1) TaxID=452637 RepID=B1ZW25_OPITP|nr:hypothetical protein Oter_2758 [Opitutus terrae PB90-1]
MRTLLATVSIGARDRLTRYSLPRMEDWSRRCGMEFQVIRRSLIPAERPPHFNKLAIPAHFPDYDRYVIVDDDLLISRHAPPPPDTPLGSIGLVPDEEQRHTRAACVKWTGNTGFIVADKSTAPVFADALVRGSDATIWGYADQSALNRSAWTMGKLESLDRRWNFMPVIHHFVTRDAWQQWSTRRTYRLGYYLDILLRPGSKNRRMIRDAYGVHLVRAPYPWLFSRLMS